MKIEHIAIWANDLEKMKAFYLKFFELEPGKKYENAKKQFSSYFLSFSDGVRIELMHKTDISEKIVRTEPDSGLAHFAISVGTKERVDQITELIRKDGYKIIGEPRTTGDGYYESVIADPEGNRIEIIE